MTDDTKAVERMPFQTDDLRMVQTFEDALALAQDAYGALADAAQEIGDGFVLLDKKDRLVDVKFIALGWSFTDGDYKTETGEVAKYAIVRVVTEKGDKYVVTDGGTGLCSQLLSYSERTKKFGGLLVERGLRRSDYEYVNDKGQTEPGTTYYLNV